MALTSIHVQDDRYTVTQSNTSIKEQKISTQRGAKSQSQASNLHLCSITWSTLTRTLRCDLYRRHTWTKPRPEPREVKKRRASGECLRTKHASEHFYIIRLLQADWLFERRKHEGSAWNEGRNQRKSTVGPISQRQREDVGCLYDDLTKLRK